MEHNLIAGWIGMLAGIVAGAVLGLFFHRDDWMGGYDSFRRRMLRLGHISFIGLGLLNMLFAVTCKVEEISGSTIDTASWMLIAGAIAMPTLCFLTAWRKPFRHLFGIPVLLVAGNIILLLIGWWR